MSTPNDEDLNAKIADGGEFVEMLSIAKSNLGGITEIAQAAKTTTVSIIEDLQKQTAGAMAAMTTTAAIIEDLQKQSADAMLAIRSRVDESASVATLAAA